MMPLVSKSSCILSISSDDAPEQQRSNASSTLDAALVVREAGAETVARRALASLLVRKLNMERTGGKQPAWSTREMWCLEEGMLGQLGGGETLQAGICNGGATDISSHGRF